IEPSPGMNGRNGWRMFTEEGEAIAKGADIEAIHVAQNFPIALLHKAILDRCEELFRSGHYAEAVEQSFMVVRDRLRALTGFERGFEAFGKAKLHVKGAIAPHVDKDFKDREMVLLHGFAKKTQKTPAHEIDQALKRKREVE